MDVTQYQKFSEFPYTFNVTKESQNVSLKDLKILIEDFSFRLLFFHSGKKNSLIFLRADIEVEKDFF